VAEVEVFLPLKGWINLDEEERRLQKEFTRVSEDLSRTQRKLQNQDFVSRARPEAVEKEKEKARVLAEREAKLKESLERVKGWRKET
jgi:valyl-tRNA synthetase